ncbi:hypothetical protein [Arthrobacter gandavensis]|uniref:hypothetical protein n=1 Tax=Arthrobacter gandavensis TaxID=169960 RepID=UPI002B26ACFD|nr:hypothetical protein [Arthrobacter gandavensis]
MAHDAALLTGVLLVLLTPCVDYVIVFSALGGADHGKLLAATPLLMIVQPLLLPPFLWLFTSGSVTGFIEPGPFLEALVLLILLPLAAAAATQLLAKRRSAFSALAAAGNASMVPLMLAVLFTVAASQARRVLEEGAALASLVPLYTAFLAVMVLAGAFTGRAGGLDYGSARALASAERRAIHWWCFPWRSPSPKPRDPPLPPSSPRPSWSSPEWHCASGSFRCSFRGPRHGPPDRTAAPEPRPGNQTDGTGVEEAAEPPY